MVQTYYLIIAVSILSCSCLALVGVLLLRGRRIGGGLAVQNGPIQAPLPIPLVDPEVLTTLSQRLALLEGRLPALQQLLDGYGAISIRMAELEARLPSLVDAMDRYSNQLVNAEKRTASRERVAKNKELTVEEAAAQMGATKAAADGKKNSAPSLPGVMGSGGNVRRT